MTTETVNEFMGRVYQAKLEKHDGSGKGSIEAAEHIFKQFNRHGLKGGKYFFVEGIKVCPIGMTEKIEEEESIPLHEKLHGTADGRIDRI